MTAQLLNRTAIVTGGASGVGYAIAAALAGRGAEVMIVDIRDDVETQARALDPDGGRITGRMCDVSRPDEVRAAVDFTLERTGRIDVLVNNAAVMHPSGPFDEWHKAVADFAPIFDVNVRGAYLFGRAVIPAMVAAGRGDIIIMSTDHVHTCGWPEQVSHQDAAQCPWSDRPRPPGVVGMDLYDASKWALNGLTQAWAKALRANGIRVNNICLGATDSPMLRRFAGYADTEPPAEVLAGWQTPSDVADIVVEAILEGPTGRSGDNIGVWRGHPAVLPPPSALLDVSHDPVT